MSLWLYKITLKTHVGNWRRLLGRFSDDLDRAEIVELDALAVEILRAVELLLELGDSWSHLALFSNPLISSRVVSPSWKVFLASQSLSRSSITSVSGVVVVGLGLDPAGLASSSVGFLVFQKASAVGGRSGLDIRQSLSQRGAKVIHCFIDVSGGGSQLKLDEVGEVGGRKVVEGRIGLN